MAARRRQRCARPEVARSNWARSQLPAAACSQRWGADWSWGARCSSASAAAAAAGSAKHRASAGRSASRASGWLETRYAQKARREGREPLLLPDPGTPFQLVHHDDVAQALLAAAVGSRAETVFQAAGLAQARHEVAEEYLGRLRGELPDGPFKGVPTLFKDLGCAIEGEPYHEGMQFLKGAGYRSPHTDNLATKYFEAGWWKTIAETLASGSIMNPSVSFTSEAFVSSTSFLRGEKKFTALVPTQLSRLATAAQHDESVLRALKTYDAILIGGQATAPALLSELREQGVNLIETYGSAETFGGVVYEGVPLPCAQVSITEDSRIQIESETLAIDIADKFVTNDLGEIVDGRLKVLGRADRVIISGGIKVSLDSVEAIAREVAGVVEMVAAPIADTEWGQRGGVMYLGSPEVADEIATQLADLLGPAAKPLRVIRVDRVPKLSSGKYDLLAAAAIFAKEHDD